MIFVILPLVRLINELISLLINFFTKGSDIMEIMLHLQVYIVSISILLVLLIKIMIEKDNDTFQSKIFTMITFFTLCVLITEAAGWVFNGKPGMNNRIILTIIDTIEFILVLIPGVFWMIYVDYSIYNSIRRVKRIAIISGLLLMYFIPLAVTTPYTKLLFYIDSSNKYNRGAWFWQSECIYYMIFIYVFAILIWNRKKIPRRILIPMLLYYLPPFAGTVLQILFYGVSLAWSGVSISILIIYVYIQNQKVTIDYLTGLYNRRKLDSYLENIAKRHKNSKKILVLMMDINKFKTINDTWGHEMGDRALKDCAMILKKCFNNREFIARYAGDEFVVVLQLKTNEDIDNVIKRLTATVNEIESIGDFPYKLSLSVGYGMFPDDGQDITKVIEVADERMYLEKNKTRL